MTSSNDTTVGSTIRVELGGETRNITWTVKFNPDSYRSRPWGWKSPQFWCLDNNWQICIKSQQQPNLSNYENYIDAYMEIVDCNYAVQTGYVLSALDCNGRKIFSWICIDHTFTTKEPRGRCEKSVKVSQFLDSKGLFSEGTLTLYCQLISGLRSGSVLPGRWMDRQLSMLTNEKYTDVIIVVGWKQFKAHKMMLAAHSPVFDAMLSSNFLESRKNKITIDDFDHEVVEEMLTYIYSDRTPKLGKLADKLLRAADKYEMIRLKRLCEQTLCATLSVDNAMKLQALAELCNANQLKSRVKQFISTNIAAVQESNDWKNMVQADSVNLLREMERRRAHNVEFWRFRALYK